jgi:hypothetical protein
MLFFLCSVSPCLRGCLQTFSPQRHRGTESLERIDTSFATIKCVSVQNGPHFHIPDLIPLKRNLLFRIFISSAVVFISQMQICRSNRRPSRFVCGKWSSNSEILLSVAVFDLHFSGKRNRNMKSSCSQRDWDSFLSATAFLFAGADAGSSKPPAVAGHWPRFEPRHPPPFYFGAASLGSARK